ncbi:hypothetical protein BDV06DRAFT_220126 [Aspergillus oleicola]
MLKRAKGRLPAEHVASVVDKAHIDSILFGWEAAGLVGRVLDSYTCTTFWWLPDIKVGENITLTNDPKLPPYVKKGCTGPWPEDFYPVKIRNPTAFTEAAI